MCGSGALDEDGLMPGALTVPVDRSLYGPISGSRSRSVPCMVVRLVDEPVLLETPFGFVHEVAYFLPRQGDQRDDRNPDRNEHERDGEDE